MDIKRNKPKGTFIISKSGYIKKVLELYNMSDAKPVNVPMGAHFIKLKYIIELSITESKFMNKFPYSNIVGSLMYSMIGARPNITYAISLISRFMSNPCKKHLYATKWLLKYLKGSIDYGQFYTTNATNQFMVKVFYDSDFVANLDKRRSLTGYVFTFGVNIVS